MSNNLDLNDYSVGFDYDTWGDKVIADLSSINSALGDVEVIATEAGTVALTQAQSNKAAHQFTATLTGNLTVDVLAGIGRNWFVQNATSGAYTVTYQVTGGAGASVAVEQGKSAIIWSDGTDCYEMSLSTLAGTIVAGQIAANAVTTAKILDANVTTGKLADGSVTSAKIADGNVGTAKIAGDAVTSAKIADSSVTTVKLANNAVTLSKLATQASYTVLGNVTGGAAVPSALSLQVDDTFASATDLALPTSLAVKTHVAATAFSSALPAQTGNAGKFITTDGENASWGDLVPASRADFLATGTVTSGKPVALLHDGTVGPIASETVVNNASTAESFTAGYYASLDSCYNSALKCFVTAYQDANNSNYGTAYITTVVNGAPSKSAPVIFESAAVEDTSIVYDTKSNRVVIAYKDVGNSGYGTAVVGEILDGVLVFGTPVVFASVSTDYVNAVYDDASGKIVISYADEGHSDYGKSIVGAVTENTIIFGSAITFEAADTRNIHSVYDELNEKVVIFYTDVGNSYRKKAIVGTVGGLAVTFGTVITVSTTYSSYGPVGCTYDAKTGSIIVVEATSSSVRKIKAGVISGTSISFGAGTTISKANNTDSFGMCYDASSGRIVMTYGPDSSGDGDIDIFYVSGTSVLFESTFEYSSGFTSRNTVIYDPVNEVCLITYREGTSGNIITFETAKTKYNSGDYLGVSETTATADTVTIALPGAVVSNQTGLTIGADYFLSDDGSLTALGNTGRKIGRAISATNLLLS